MSSEPGCTCDAVVGHHNGCAVRATIGLCAVPKVVKGKRLAVELDGKRYVYDVLNATDTPTGQTLETRLLEVQEP